MIIGVLADEYHDNNRKRCKALKYIERILDPRPILSKKSMFLFGPRQTGKSALIRHLLSDYKVYNLLDRKIYQSLQANPSLIRQEIRPEDEIIIIDENTIYCYDTPYTALNRETISKVYGVVVDVLYPDDPQIPQINVIKPNRTDKK